jgi:D-alanyl-D-alanine carboxypeptidase
VDKKTLIVRFLVFTCVIVATLLIGFANFDDASAATKKKKKAAKAAQTKPYSAIVVDAQTGEVLMARQADSIRHPASLTKMMTLYMLFEAVESGRLRMNDSIQISSHAASMAPSKLGIPPGQSIRVEDAVQAIVTKSANDVATAVAEKLGGSERVFCAKMTRKAHDLGMTRTNFRNASGLPDPQQVTSARDMAKLAIALLRDFPQYYHYFGIRNFEYRGMVMANHNRLLGEYPGLDGIKTGYINASGFNLVASAKQNGRRLVGVVFGGRTWRSRNDNMVQLLDSGFAELGRRRSQTQEASAAPLKTIPIPLPPPTMDDARGVDTAMMTTTSDDETDSAEDGAAYTPADAKQITAMIDQAQGDDAREAAQQVALNAPVPIPVPRPAGLVSGSLSVQPLEEAAMDPSAGAANTVPAAAARTVMQLRIPASQAKNIPASQIVSTDPDGHNWSIQVGAFPSRAMTDQALRTAQSRLPTHLQGGQPVIVPQNTNGGMIFRARLQGFDQGQANAACAHLGSCLVVAPGS